MSNGLAEPNGSMPSSSRCRALYRLFVWLTCFDTIEYRRPRADSTAPRSEREYRCSGTRTDRPAPSRTRMSQSSSGMDSLVGAGTKPTTPTPRRAGRPSLCPSSSNIGTNGSAPSPSGSMPSASEPSYSSSSSTDIPTSFEKTEDGREESRGYGTIPPIMDVSRSDVTRCIWHGPSARPPRPSARSRRRRAR